MNYKQLLKQKPDNNLANFVIHYETLGDRVVTKAKQPKFTKKQIDTIGIWACNGVLLTFVFIARLVRG